MFLLTTFLKVRPIIPSKTRSGVFQTLARWPFAALRENQKLDREFVKFGQVFKKLVRVIKKLGHVFVLWHGQMCLNQPR